MLGISQSDRVRNEEIRGRIKVEDIIARIMKLKWNWVEHIARQGDKKWTKYIVQWRPKQHRWSVGKPQRRWIDDIKKRVGKRWIQEAQNRSEWRKKGELISRSG